MPKAQFQADRYHMTMGNFALTEHALFSGRRPLAEIEAVFYCAFRKLKFAPCVGHERLVENLTHISLDAPRIRFLKNDKAGLGLVAKYLVSQQLRGKVRTVKPGTIVFAGEPFADITGPFALTQLAEIKFEHGFDIPVTVASRALEMRLAAGPDRFLSDFSLRRDGEVDRSVDGGIKNAIDRALREKSFLEAVEIEVKTVSQLAVVLQDGRIKHVLLDKMSLEDMKEAVKRCGHTHILEASGIGGKTLREVAECGVHFISSGSLIEGAKRIDMHMEIIGNV